MGDASTIEWTDATWNPVTGCSKVSPGCAHCYAEELTQRFASTWGVPGLPWTPENAPENVILRPERLDQPLRWRRPRRVFVNSMSDLFHEQVPDDYIARVFDVMAQAPQHTFQVLTKRPERMRDLTLSYEGWDRALNDPPMWPLPNVWLGVSIENRRFVHRADLLRETPAAVRFISAEPLLGPLIPGPEHDAHPEFPWPRLDLTDIDWLIVGGESGPKHRPIREEWVRDLLGACLAQCSDCAALGSYVSEGWRHRFDDGHSHWRPCPRQTAFFLKQWGGRTPKANGRELDGRTWDEFPEFSEARAREAA